MGPGGGERGGRQGACCRCHRPSSRAPVCTLGSAPARGVSWMGGGEAGEPAATATVYPPPRAPTAVGWGVLPSPPPADAALRQHHARGALSPPPAAPRAVRGAACHEQRCHEGVRCLPRPRSPPPMRVPAWGGLGAATRLVLAGLHPPTTTTTPFYPRPRPARPRREWAPGRAVRDATDIRGGDPRAAYPAAPFFPESRPPGLRRRAPPTAASRSFFSVLFALQPRSVVGWGRGVAVVAVAVGGGGVAVLPTRRCAGTDRRARRRLRRGWPSGGGRRGAADRRRGAPLRLPAV